MWAHFYLSLTQVIIRSFTLSSWDSLLHIPFLSVLISCKLFHFFTAVRAQTRSISNVSKILQQVLLKVHNKQHLSDTCVGNIAAPVSEDTLSASPGASCVAGSVFGRHLLDCFCVSVVCHWLLMECGLLVNYRSHFLLCQTCAHNNLSTQ